MADELEQVKPKYTEEELGAMGSLLEDVTSPATSEEASTSEEKSEAKAELKPEGEPEAKPEGEEKPKGEEEEEVKPVEVKPVEAQPAATDEAATLRIEIDKLRQQLNELAKPATQATPAASPAETLPPKAEATAEVQFVTDEEAEALLDDPKGLNKILNKVFQAGREMTLRDIPALVRQQAASEMTLQQKTQAFWAENKDLEQYRDFAAMVANQIEIAEPNLTFDEVLEKTGTTVRERLNLVRPADDGTPPAEKPKVEEGEVSTKPALPGGTKGARRPAPTVKPTEGQQREIEDMGKAFGF